MREPETHCAHNVPMGMSCSACLALWNAPIKRPHDYEPWSMKCRGCGWVKAQIDRWATHTAAWDFCRGSAGPTPEKDRALVGSRTKRRKRVYVSGPLTTGMLTANVRRAADAANELLDAGFAVYLPHTNVLWEMIAPPIDDYAKGYEKWLGHDFEWVGACDVVLRLDGPSHGADREVELAISRGIPVYKTVRQIIAEEETTVAA